MINHYRSACLFCRAVGYCTQLGYDWACYLTVFVVILNMSEDPLFRLSALGLVLECTSTSIPIPDYESVEWIPTTTYRAHELADKAVVAGYEVHDHSPLWVIRARFKNDLVPGKLAVNRKQAYVAFRNAEHQVYDIEVCCVASSNIRWVDGRDGFTPPTAMVGGCTSSGEHLYIGRTKVNGALTPGKIQPSKGVMFVSYGFKELSFKNYEVLCLNSMCL